MENFYAPDFDIDDYIFPRNEGVGIRLFKSKRRGIKRKLKKIVKKAEKVFDENLGNEFSLKDSYYEDEM